MASIIPPVHVPAPVAGPVRYGLFNAARVLDLPKPGALGGVEFEPDTCGVARLYTAECPPSAQDVKVLTDGQDFVSTDPFWVYASIVCAPVGRTLEEQERRAIQRLYAGEQTQVERAFWDGGGVGATPALTTVTSSLVVTAATTFGARLAALEEAFYDTYGYQGTIHVNTRAYGAAAFGNLIVRPDTPPMPGQLATPLGSLWSFGAGYDITGPANAAPAAGSVWAFMTGPVTVWRDPEVSVPNPEGTFNRTLNQATVEAVRGYTVSPDCPTVWAVELPLEAP